MMQSFVRRAGPLARSGIRTTPMHACIPAISSTSGVEQRRNFISVIEKFARAYREFGWRDTLWKMYWNGDVKFGRLVGEDKYGTKYYESVDEPFGQHRWAEYKFDFKDKDPSMIPPEWHIWLHSTVDEPPSEQKPDQPDYHKNSEGAHTPYNHHLGLRVQDYSEHLTTAKARGYGEGSLLTKWGEKDRQYLQPNHPLRNRKRLEKDFE